MARLVYRGVAVNVSDETAGQLSSDFKAEEKKAAAEKRTAAKSDSK